MRFALGVAAALFALAACAPVAIAQEPANPPPVKVNLIEALGRKYPFPLFVNLAETDLKERFTRQVVSPQGKPHYGFSLLLRKNGWKEVPTQVEDLEHAPGPFRLLAAVCDLDPTAQAFLTVDFCRMKSIIDPLEYLEELAGNGGWMLLGRQVFLRQEGNAYVRVPNVLALLPEDPKTGERTVARATIRLEGDRAFVAVYGVRESRYAEVAEELALAAQTFDVEEKTAASYAEALRQVKLKNGAAAGKFEVAESWIVRENPAQDADVASAGLELAAADGKLIGAMGVFVYPKSVFHHMELADRVKAVQGFVGAATEAKGWTWVERIAFVSSRRHGPQEGTVEIYRADLIPASGPTVPKGLELRIAWLWDDGHWVLAWLYTYAQRGDRAGHAIARRAFSLVMDTLELE